MITFIVNPTRPSIGTRWPFEEERIRKSEIDFKTYLVRGKNHAEILTEKALEEGTSLIVVAAGDSTLNEVISALHRQQKLGKTIPPLTLYPELQHGDAVRSLSLRSSFSDFLEAWKSKQAIEENLDLGEVTFTGDYGQRVTKIFFNCAGFGLSAQLVTYLSRKRVRKKNAWAFFKALARLLPFVKFPLLEIKMDNEAPQTFELLTGLIHNGRYAAYGLDMSEASQMSDGKFECTLVKKTLRTRYLLGVLSLISGNLKKLSYVNSRQIREIEIKPLQRQKQVRIDFDGDSWGFLPARFKVLDKALHFVR